eukprot:CAMPEP_0177785634 /NCGR_PEP_ID=MMETSP0491_2-20121128/20450_1 /TAXON_ID=63592 /ORGANISM="Tetraselmis chuii, Strain PLY429" /LENGTH=193 /DNA_ID=CAMNT_0019306703 /DNA_START=632 /DNA_END=1210 /DNA_ORIENTATION=-
MNAHGSSLIGGSPKLVTPVDRSTDFTQANNILLRLHAATRSRANAYPGDNSTFPRTFEEDDNADPPTEFRPGDKTKKTSPWKCRRTPNRQTDPPPLQDLPSPKKHNDNKSAPLSASLQKPRQAHLLPTPMSSVSSLYVSHSDPPLPLPVCTSQKNTLLCRPRTPLLLPTYGEEMQRHDPYSTRSLLPCLAGST